MIYDWITALIIVVAISGLYVLVHGWILGRRLKRLRQMNLDALEAVEAHKQQLRLVRSHYFSENRIAESRKLIEEHRARWIPPGHIY